MTVKNNKGHQGFVLFDNDLLGYTFKEKKVQKGVYKFPFTFRLPLHVPGSFRWQDKKGESFSIKYFMSAYISDMKEHLSVKQEILIREFLFIKEEIDQDWKFY